MGGEGRDLDYKLNFDPSSPKAWAGLIKDLVAMANSGGGKIIFGRDETRMDGITEEIVKDLDSARLADKLAKFTAPAQIYIRHEQEKLDNGRYILTIIVEPSEYPVVMARDGNWPDIKKAVFRKGDIWIRHSSKTERATYEDLREWIERAKQRERERILSRLKTVINAPEGAKVEIITPSGYPIDSPEYLLENAVSRRRRNLSHLLTREELLWVFITRSTLHLTEEMLKILVGSALRRPSTLYWWLLQAEEKPDIILEEASKVFDSSDRDKSDAAQSVVEVVALYADDQTIDAVIERLAKSRYKHLRDAAEGWKGREGQKRKLAQRIKRARYGGQMLYSLFIPELEDLATELAIAQLKRKTAHLSRSLGDVTRVIWSKRSKYADFVSESA